MKIHSKSQLSLNHLLPIFSIGVLGFFGISFAASTLFAEAAPASAKTDLPPLSSTPLAVSLMSNGTIDLTLETVPYTNVVRSGVDHITPTLTPQVSANLKLYLSTNSTESNALINNDSEATIPATIPLKDRPADILTGNSWGFALVNSPAIPSDTGFDDSYTAGDPGKNSKWAGVPIKGQEQLIHTQSVSAGASPSPVDVYYAASAKDNLPEGSYHGTVVYTAIAEPTAAQTATLDPPSGSQGTEITITLNDAKTDMDNPGTATITYTKDSDTVTVPNVPIQVVQEGSDKGTMYITTNVPELPSAGDYTVSATLDQTGTTYTASPDFTYTIPAYIVNYNANGGEGVPEREYQPADFATQPDWTFQLKDDGTIPTRDGYTFGGWTEHAGNQAGAYSPGSEIYLKHTDDPETNRTEVTLYAIWVPNSEMGFGSLTGDNAKMQNMNQSVCSGVATGVTGRLQDTRDYKIYYVTKEADGKCWMTQNLSLDIRTEDSEGNPYKYTSADTNITDGTEWKPGESASNYKNTIPYQKLSRSTWTGNANLPSSYNPADDYFFTTGTNTSSNDKEYTDVSACTADGHSLADCTHSATGNYYSWSAAVASNNTEGHSTQYENMPNSICPKGWRLPKTTSSVSSEPSALIYKAGSTDDEVYPDYVQEPVHGFIKIRQDPLWLVRSGVVGWSGSRSSLGSSGNYWSSAVYSSGYAYGPSFVQYKPSPMGSNNRSNGVSLRCLAD